MHGTYVTFNSIGHWVQFFILQVFFPSKLHNIVRRTNCQRFFNGNLCHLVHMFLSIYPAIHSSIHLPQLPVQLHESSFPLLLLSTSPLFLFINILYFSDFITVAQYLKVEEKTNCKLPGATTPPLIQSENALPWFKERIAFSEYRPC